MLYAKANKRIYETIFIERSAKHVGHSEALLRFIWFFIGRVSRHDSIQESTNWNQIKSVSNDKSLD